MKPWLLFPFLLLLVLYAADLSADTPTKERATDNLARQVVLICFPVDTAVTTSCERTAASLKAAGWHPVEVRIKSPDDIPARIAALAEEGIPLTAPVFVHGHGYEIPADSDHHHFVVGRAPGKKDVTTDSADFIRALRRSLPTNPLWISSCRSGSLCAVGDACLGTSSKAKELSNAPKGGSEVTLEALVKIVADRKEFDKADRDANGVLSPSELGAYLCRRMGTREIHQVYSNVEGYRSDVKVSVEADVNRELARLREKHGPGAKQIVKTTPRYAVKFRTDEGKEMIEKLDVPETHHSKLSQVERWAKESWKDWPASCTEQDRISSSRSDDDFPRVRPGSGAEAFRGRRNGCSILPIGTVWELTVRFEGEPCMTDLFGGPLQSPQLNTFRLYSPGFTYREEPRPRIGNRITETPTHR